MRDLDRAVTHGKLDEIEQSRARVRRAGRRRRRARSSRSTDWRSPTGGCSRCSARERTTSAASSARRGSAPAIARLRRTQSSRMRSLSRRGCRDFRFRTCPMATMTLGPEIEENSARASGMAPQNPRVALLVAIGTLHKPAFVGGGADKAKPQFERAIALYDSAGHGHERDRTGAASMRTCGRAAASRARGLDGRPRPLPAGAGDRTRARVDQARAVAGSREAARREGGHDR